jgi:hypothetical protein
MRRRRWPPSAAAAAARLPPEAKNDHDTFGLALHSWRIFIALHLQNA